MMRIAILTSGILPIPAVQGGAVENFLDFFLEYNNIHQRHDITVYSIYHPKVKEHPALESKVNHYYYIQTDSLWAKFRKRLFSKRHPDTYHHYSIEFFLYESLKHIRKQNYDAIILNNRPGYAEVLDGKTNAKLVYNLYNDKLNNTTRSHQQIYDAASLIISTSDYISNRVRTIGDSGNKCVTVYSGIELDKFSSSITPRVSRNDLGLSPSDFILLFSGRVNKEKGVLELISAIQQLEQYPNIKLLILGSSFFGNASKDDSFIQSLKQRAKDIKDRIIFTGFIPYEMMPDYLKISDVATIPSNWDDPFPTTVLEAQAMGLPIITTRRGGIPEEVTEENAILLDTDEQFVDHLVKAILELYNHPEKRQQMSNVSIERSRLFDKESYAKNFFAALENNI
jgi:glycosyltransferase involved in cell wall biosynthesis